MEKSELILFYKNIIEKIENNEITNKQSITLHIFKHVFLNDTVFEKKTDEEFINYLFLGWYISNFVIEN